MKLIFLILLLYCSISTATIFGDELRAVWYNVYQIDVANEPVAKETITRHFELMQQMKINTVFFLVKFTDGAVYYDSEICPRRSSWDCLAYIIETARKYNISVHAYVNVFCEEGDYLKQYPEYADFTVTGTTLTWSSPAIKEVRDRAINIMLELVRKYKVDGIQLDRIRYSSSKAGYNPVSVQLYRQTYGKEPVLTDPEWTKFRLDLISSFVAEAYRTLKNENSRLTFSVAVFHSPQTSARVLQDWPTWVKNGYVDLVCTMSYTATKSVFTSYVDENIVAVQGSTIPLTIGIGAYYAGMNKDILYNQLSLVRQRNLPGMVFFNAYNLWENPDLMATVTQFYSQPPTRETVFSINEMSNELPEYVPDNCYRGYLEVP